MSNTQTTEWKSISLSKEAPDFTGAKQALLECDGDTFIALTFKTKNGRTVRIRKADYSLRVEEPVVPTVTKYLAKTKGGLKTLFDNKEEAERAMEGVQEGEIDEIVIPAQEEVKHEDLPF